MTSFTLDIIDLDSILVLCWTCMNPRLPSRDWLDLAGSANPERCVGSPMTLTKFQNLEGPTINLLFSNGMFTDSHLLIDCTQMCCENLSLIYFSSSIQICPLAQPPHGSEFPPRRYLTPQAIYPSHTSSKSAIGGIRNVSIYVKYCKRTHISYILNIYVYIVHIMCNVMTSFCVRTW